MENFAPERTLTKSGFSPEPSFCFCCCSRRRSPSSVCRFTWGEKTPPWTSNEENYPVYPIYSGVVVTGCRGRADTGSFVHNTSAISPLDSRAQALTQSDKEVHGHGDADGDHNPTDLFRIAF